MNVVFFIVCALSVGILTFLSPEKALPAMLSGANKALKLTFTLVPVYAVWTGLYKILEQSEITSKLSRLLSKPIRALFGTTSDKAEEYISLNISANMLGLGGVATPLGIKACAELEKTKSYDAAELLLVIASTSVQLLPVSVISLMIGYGSVKYPSIILPCFLSTVFSSVFGISFFLLLSKLRNKRTARKNKNTV